MIQPRCLILSSATASTLSTGPVSSSKPSVRSLNDTFGAAIARFACADSCDPLMTQTSNVLLQIAVLSDWPLSNSGSNLNFRAFQKMSVLPSLPQICGILSLSMKSMSLFEEPKEAYQTMWFRDALKSSFYDK